MLSKFILQYFLSARVFKHFQAWMSDWKTELLSCTALIWNLLDYPNINLKTRYQLEEYTYTRCKGKNASSSTWTLLKKIIIISVYMITVLNSYGRLQLHFNNSQISPYTCMCNDINIMCNDAILNSLLCYMLLKEISAFGMPCKEFVVIFPMKKSWWVQQKYIY